VSVEGKGDVRQMKPRTIALDTRMDFVALLGALCLFLSTIEYMLPKPVPFLRIGIANLPILIGLDLLPVPSLLLVVLLKVVGQGLVGGTLFSYVFLFSAVGSFASGLSMILIRRTLGKRISLVGVGVLGALFSNMAQIVLARFLIFGEGAWLIAPPFLALGTVTSVVLGLFAEKFSATSRWLASVRVGGRPTGHAGTRRAPGGRQ
jgi:heptaprenyl diphosphate synthase